MRFSGIRKFLLYISAVMVSIYIVLPIYWAFIISVKKPDEIYSKIPSLVPSKITFDRYVAVFTGNEKLLPAGGRVIGSATLQSFMQGFMNSIIVGALTTALCLLIGVPAAYAFARYIFKGRTFILSFLTVTRFIPVVLLVIPLYFITLSMNLYDNVVGLSLVYTAFELPIVMIVMMAYYEGLPRSLEDAAILDGCSTFDLLFKVIVPVSLPGMIASSILAFIMAWQEFIFALVLTSSRAKTMPIVLAEFFGRYGPQYDMLCTGAILAALPILIISACLSKYIIKGISEGMGRVI